MKPYAGVDIGNSTTEVAIGMKDASGQLTFLGVGSAKTTGTKGTISNVTGVVTALEKALEDASLTRSDLGLIHINQAAPVIGDSAMETITETLITESTMVGHNPDTPAGEGVGIGITIDILDINRSDKTLSYLALVEDMDYEEVARRINELIQAGYKISGVVLQKDDAVLVHNRLETSCPIIDEVYGIHKIPRHRLGAIEVATLGKSIQTLSNPYDIATIFKLDSSETKRVLPIAKSLVGNRSALIVRTKGGEVIEKSIPAGKIYLIEEEKSHLVDVDEGANKIMEALKGTKSLQDVKGEKDTNIGIMLDSMKEHLGRLTNKEMDHIRVNDLLAVDSLRPIKIQGGIAGEIAMEKAVSLAAMVKAKGLPMLQLASAIESKLGITTRVIGVEAIMAAVGALTTPGTALPLTLCDMGGGSTDFAYIDHNGHVFTKHLAGAGNMVTMLINMELGLEDFYLAEKIKKLPVAKVESLFHIRMESGQVTYVKDPLPPTLYGRLVIIDGTDYIPIHHNVTMEKVITLRKEAKKRVFLSNINRGLHMLEQEGLSCSTMVLVGGSALDFELPGMLLDHLSRKGITVGRGNIQGKYGPRKAVATGLLLMQEGNSYEGAL